MANYSFSLNPGIPLSISTPSCANNTSLATYQASVLHPPPPPSAPPQSLTPSLPSNTGHLIAMQHHLLNTSRPLLIGHQGFSLPTPNCHQFLNEGLYAARTVNHAVIPAGLNDSPLEFNFPQNKSVFSQLTSNFQDKTQQLKSMINNLDKLTPSLSNIDETSVKIKSQITDIKSNSANKVIPIELDEENIDCEVITEVKLNNDNNSSDTSVKKISGSNRYLPSLVSNPTLWNTIMPNMNISVVSDNQFLTSNVIDSNLFSGQTLGILGNTISQLPNTNANVNACESSTNQSNKTVIHYKHCTLTPPHSQAPARTTRERPPGCKTVFVGGLPENIKEEIIREVFGFCGEITSVRLSNKKFCHIRFAEESAVDEALTLSGYRMRLGPNSDAPNTGRLHVDFAHARDDQYEWECKQRQIQREQRHKERLLRDNCRDIEPSGSNHFTENEANSVLEKLKSEDTFLKAISMAVCWLERGECNKRNVNTFYSMIQSVNSHVRRLLHDKNQCDIEFKKAKDLMKTRTLSIFTQFAQIEKMFVSSSHKKVWDHFTKAQRKNIELWKKTAMEIKKLPLEEILNDEMDFSDSDSDEKPFKKRKIDLSETYSLKDENDSLRCQLEAYKNEICVIRSELHCDISRKNEQLVILQNTINTLNQKLNNTKRQPSQESTNVESRVENAQEADTTASVSANNLILVEKEAALIGLISIFLHVHPFGAGIDYIYSYLQKTVPTLDVFEIEYLMNKFPSIFQQEVIGIGACMERRWKYAGLRNQNETSAVVRT